MTEINSVKQLVDYAAEKYKDKVFCRFIRDGQIYSRSFTEFRLNAYSVCRYIRSITKDKLHIAFIGKTNYEYIACLTGMIISGNTVVPFAPDISVEEACRLFDDADIDIIFCEEDFLNTAEEIKSRLSHIRSIVSLGDSKGFEEIFNKFSDEEYRYLSDIEPDPSELSLIIYTSGTTGDKKGVMLSSDNLAANSTYDTYTMENDDVSFSILPMHHIFCYSCDVLKTLYDGGTLCLNGAMNDMYNNFLLFEPTVMRIVPSVLRSLLTKIRITERRNPQFTKREAAEAVVGRNMRKMIAGSAFLSRSLIDEFEKYGIIARQGYGMSECSPRITTADFSDECKYSNGKLTGVDEVRVIDGEIQVRGPSVMMGYYKKPDETAKVFTEDGFLHTGDAGYIENEHIFLVGRKKNVIVLSNGENISPEEIENRFADETAVKEIIVFAKDDKLCAEIYADTAADESDIEEIIDKINILSPSDRQIDSFTLRELPFPKTSTGKIKRTEFRFSQEETQ